MANPEKKFDCTPENLEKVEQWAAEGYTIASMGRSLGVSHQKFIEWRKQHPQLQEAIDRGRQADEQLCKNKIREIAFDNLSKSQLTALMYYTKTIHGWNDGSRRDNGEQVTPPKIEISFKEPNVE